MGKKKTGKQPAVTIDESGPEFLLKGRRPCLCEASRHPLVANCLSCGRIVCEQESSGPCFTCGTFVFTKEERDFLMSGTPEALKRLEHLFESGVSIDFLDKVSGLKNVAKNLSLREIAESLTAKDDENLTKAIKHKDKLLEYDKNSVARSTVYDDQFDYFQLRSQNFVSGKNRQEIINRVDYIQENKFNRTDKIVLDLENLTVNDYREPVIADMAEEHRKLEELSKIKTDYEMKPSAHFIDSKTKKNIPPVIYIPNENSSGVIDNVKFPEHILSMDEYRKKIQDQDLNKFDDQGMALAMRQPYASLLVNGIKRFEGRSWYTPFRGRLWIYAGQKKPTDNDIAQVEQLYRHMGHEKFPKNYPTGAMVGCVIVEDCLPNDVYREQYPECEIDDPFAFVCDYPIAFRRPLPVQKGGGQQIYKMDPQVHRACKGMLGF